MPNNINWLGNPVVDANAPTQTSPRMPYQSSVNQNVQEMTPNEPQYNMNAEGPPMISEPGYIPNYLLKNIGKNVRAEFIINSSYIDKVGKLIEVGINYFVLDDVNSKTHIMCDLYSVKFVTVIV